MKRLSVRVGSRLGSAVAPCPRRAHGLSSPGGALSVSIRAPRFKSAAVRRASSCRRGRRTRAAAVADSRTAHRPRCAAAVGASVGSGGWSAGRGAARARRSMIGRASRPASSPRRGAGQWMRTRRRSGRTRCRRPRTAMERVLRRRPGSSRPAPPARWQRHCPCSGGTSGHRSRGADRVQSSTAVPVQSPRQRLLDSAALKSGAGNRRCVADTKEYTRRLVGRGVSVDQQRLCAPWPVIRH